MVNKIGREVFAPEVILFRNTFLLNWLPFTIATRNIYSVLSGFVRHFIGSFALLSLLLLSSLFFLLSLLLKHNDKRDLRYPQIANALI